jgi:phage FluMu gp28-like protein
MNTSLNSLLLWTEKKRDPKRFATEYGCEFLQAASALIPADLIDKAVVVGQREFPNQKDIRGIAALDPSSKGADAFAFAVAHKRSDGKVVLDLARQWKSPGNGQFIDYNYVVPSIIETANMFQVTQVYSDQVCAAALAAMFQKKGMKFEQVVTYGTRAQELYRSVRQLFVSGDVILPDNPELISQLKKLEEFLVEGGRSLVEAKTGHDDLAVASCLALYQGSLMACGLAPKVVPLFADLERDENDGTWHRLDPDGRIIGGDSWQRPAPIPSFARPRFTSS